MLNAFKKIFQKKTNDTPDLRLTIKIAADENRQKSRLPDLMEMKKIIEGDFTIDEANKIESANELTSEDFNALALGFKLQNNCDKALEYFYKAIAKDPEYGSPYGNAISVCAAFGKPDIAEKLFRNGLQNAKTDNDFIYYQYGRGLAMNGNPLEASEIALEGIENTKPEDDALFILAAKSFLKIADNVRMLDNSGETINKYLNMAAQITQIGLRCFPNSRDLKDIEAMFK